MMENMLRSSSYNIVFEGTGEEVFICNSLKGTYAFLNKSDYNKLMNKNLSLPNVKLNDLRDNEIIEENFLVDDSKVDNGMPEISIPTAFILPTYDCNLQCEYCFQRKGEKVDENNQLNILHKAVDIIKKNKYYTNPIYLFGGEPILYKNRIFLENFLMVIKNNNWKFAAFTNGTQIEGYIELFREYSIYCDHLHITIDGGETSHNQRRGQNTYQIIKSNIKELVSLGIKIKIRVNVDSVTISTLEDLLLDYLDLTNTGLAVIYCAAIRESLCNMKVDSENFLSNDIRKKLLELKGKYNFQLKNFLGLEFGEKIKNGIGLDKRKEFCNPKILFDPSGICYPCISSAAFPHLAIDIDKDADNWWIQKRGQNKLDCKECKYFYFCGGGCSLEWEQNNVYRCKEYIEDNIRFSLNFYLTRNDF